MRKTGPSIKSRTRWALVLLASFVACLNLWFLAGVSKWSEDFILEQLLQREIEFATKLLDREEVLPEHSSSLFRSYLDLTDIPKTMQSWVRSLEPGIHEAEDEKEGFSAMAAILNHPLAGKVYLVGDIGEAEYLESNRDFVLPFALVSLGISIFIAYLLSGYLSARTVRPLTLLESKIASTSFRDSELSLSKSLPDDEIGRLARAFEVARADLASFALREQRFTSDVSHELRTPLMAASNALQLFRQHETNEDDKKIQYLDRVDRGLRKMGSLVRTFLSLAREESLKSESSKVAIWPLLEESFKTHCDLYPHKQLRLEKIGDAAATIEGPPQLVEVLFTNLMGNAVQYSIREDIVAEVVSNTAGTVVNISNAASTAALDAKALGKRFARGTDLPGGNGIGLSIAQRICEVVGWKLTLTTTRSGRVVASVRTS